MLMLVDGRVILGLGEPGLPGAVSQPSLVIGRTMYYFLFNPLELSIPEEFGNLTISNVSADLSRFILLCHIRGIPNKYVFSLKLVINTLFLPLKGVLLTFWVVFLTVFSLNI